MENWKVTQIELVQREIGQPDRQAALACESVSWQPPSDIPPSRDDGTESGYLIVRGIDVPRLADISWVPTHVRFNAEGYMEAREFAVTGWEADPGSRTLKLPIP
ncbi:hypothetical protein [Bordetella genomosp. 9]|uniref:Uncharacterized protein n=1 Tax=Bordetella genomosp. 9 TaxID=1416803 RepID=A0A1W6Z1M1_9BORD|nr:hypothetical protein [Bordetella genomosp. 9]ARP87272.1 hypothetical protein CAL13_14465 [Bordetella genomosp. 9]